MLECAGGLEGFAPRGETVGWWECDLADNALTWTSGVFDLFGFVRSSAVTREQALAGYAEHSRVILERLRADAISHGCGFTLDAELKPVGGTPRWIRIVAAPDVRDGRVVSLHGLKFSLRGDQPADRLRG